MFILGFILGFIVGFNLLMVIAVCMAATRHDNAVSKEEWKQEDD